MGNYRHKVVRLMKLLHMHNEYNYINIFSHYHLESLI